MASKSTKKTLLQYLGLGLFSVALICFTLMLGLDNYRVDEGALTSFVSGRLGEDKSEWQLDALQSVLSERGNPEQEFATTFAYNKELDALFAKANERINDRINTEGLPEGVQAWQVKIPSWLTSNIDERFGLTRAAAAGPVSSNPALWLFLTFGLAIIGGLLYIIPKFRQHPGIKNDHVYHHPLTRGLRYGWRAFFLAVISLGVLVYGITYMDDKYLWPGLSAGLALLILLLAVAADRGWLKSPVRSAGPGEWTAWLGVVAGIYFVTFYVFLYWQPQHIVAWSKISDPVSLSLSGYPAGRWTIYGMMYTAIVAVMGVRMWAKYRHNKYQLIRTGSVVFFQTAFAFLIPEILVALNQPWYDFKSFWPLEYSLFDEGKVNSLWAAGALGKSMLLWGIGVVIVGIPLMVHLVGKRWYCSWVCGCGGLAETMGDPWRQLSDKSVRAWRVERWLIHGVLVFAVVMTAGVIYSYLPKKDYWFTQTSFLILTMGLLSIAMGYAWYLYQQGRVDISKLGMRIGLAVTVLLVAGLAYRLSAGGDSLLWIDNGSSRKWYGFLIGAGFSGVVGTGFYPLMGNRVWCRFGCPLAAYLGLVQRFQSRFRITTNGGQCISCGNCSTYCEMGIDVRAYAQRGQDIVRSSCVGCGICSAVCPRGVLRLENASGDISERTAALRTIHVTEDDIRIMV
ncbi:MAG: 4Fe-4S dicluster domain-containing protein [Bacteroidota bacterium]